MHYFLGRSADLARTLEQKRDGEGQKWWGMIRFGSAKFALTTYGAWRRRPRVFLSD
jgi:hypothetical protein